MRQTWKLICLYYKSFAAFVIGATGAATFALFVLLIAIDVLQSPISIDAISVPKGLNDRGYTPSAVALQLRDALEATINTADVTIASRLKSAQSTPLSVREESVALSTDRPNIVVPSVGISGDTISAAISSVLRVGHRRTVSGEITEDRGRLRLRIRLNGKVISETSQGLSDPAPLLYVAALGILENTQPFLAAAALADKSPTQALHETDRIKLDRWPTTDDNVANAYELRGLLFLNWQMYDKSYASYAAAIRLRPKSAYAYNNVGVVLAAQGRTADAITQYNQAIARDPNYAAAYNNLGDVMAQRHDISGAEAAFRKAIKIDNDFAIAYAGLGLVLAMRHDFAEALYDERRAVALAPEAAWSHDDYAVVLEKSNRRSQAEDEYFDATRANPHSSRAREELGSFLEREHKAASAEEQYRKCTTLDKNNKRCRSRMSSK